MTTAYYRATSKELIGIVSFEKAGKDKPRLNFTWNTNPVFYMLEPATPIQDEYGKRLAFQEFLDLLLRCEVQRYDRWIQLE